MRFPLKEVWEKDTKQTEKKINDEKQIRKLELDFEAVKKYILEEIKFMQDDFNNALSKDVDAQTVLSTNLPHALEKKEVNETIKEIDSEFFDKIPKSAEDYPQEFPLLKITFKKNNSTSILLNFSAYNKYGADWKKQVEDKLNKIFNKSNILQNFLDDYQMKSKLRNSLSNSLNENKLKPVDVESILQTEKEPLISTKLTMQQEFEDLENYQPGCCHRFFSCR